MHTIYVQIGRESLWEWRQGSGGRRWCAAQIIKRRIYKGEAHRFYPLPLEGGGPEGRGLAKPQARKKGEAHRFYPLPLEGGGPEGRGLGEEAAARANFHRFAVANLHH